MLLLFLFFVDVIADIVFVLDVHKATGGVVVDVDVCFFVVVLLFCVRFLIVSFPYPVRVMPQRRLSRLQACNLVHFRY